MRLYFFRHAIAEDGNENLPDEKRALTERGIANTKQAARVLKALGVAPDHLYSSPLLRARQTADLLGQTLDVAVEERAEVGPGFSIYAVETLTAELGEADELLLVGHEPDFSKTITSLVGGRILLKRGGFVRVDTISRQPMLGELVWLLAPKIFDELH